MPPFLTGPELSRVLEVVWFVPIVICVLLSIVMQPDAHSHTAFALMGGIFAFLVPYILGRSFLFLLVWFKKDIVGLFTQFVVGGLYICYMALSTVLLEVFRQMSLVALPEENVEDAMAHCFVFQLFSCCFLNFMFIELSPLSGTFVAVTFVRGVLAVARGSGTFSSLMYYLQERAGVMPDILSRPVLTLYMDLRWAHQSLVAEIIAMVAVIVAILSEYMVTSCDTKTGQLKIVGEAVAKETKNVFPVLTSDFSCAQTVSLLVSDFIVLAVMMIALVFSTSIWHHKFHAMKNIMHVTLKTTRTRAMMKTAVVLPPSSPSSPSSPAPKVSKWKAAKKKIKAAQAVGALSMERHRRTRRPSFSMTKRSSRLALRLTNLHKREDHIKSVLKLKSWHSMTSMIDSMDESDQDAANNLPPSRKSTVSSSGSSSSSSHKSTFSHQDRIAQARRIAVKATERFNKKMG